MSFLTFLSPYTVLSVHYNNFNHTVLRLLLLFLILYFSNIHPEEINMEKGLCVRVCVCVYCTSFTMLFVKEVQSWLEFYEWNKELGTDSVFTDRSHKVSQSEDEPKGLFIFT